MARKKIDPGTIAGTGKDPENKLIVQKTRPLFALWRSDITLAEFKILDMYLARINTHDPEKRTVRLTKGELEQALKISKISKRDLTQRLKNLYQPVDLEAGNDTKIRLVGLFEEAEAEQDEYGIWQVSLTCTTSAMKYIFKAEELGYLRYKLRNITNLTSRYTYILFTYLEDNRFRKTWEIDVGELRQILNCDKDESYAAFKVFNDRILKRCHKELHEKTECRFTYEPVKAGRKVIAVKFTLETIADLLPDKELDGQQQLPWFDEDPGDHLAFLGSACRNEFSREQMEEIFSVICTKTINQLPVAPGHPGDLEFSRYHYLAQMYARMQVVASKEKIYHRYDYFLAMLKKDR